MFIVFCFLTFVLVNNFNFIIPIKQTIMFSTEKTSLKDGPSTQGGPDGNEQNQPPKKGCCESFCDGMSECL
jgi:hypothetical protein